MKVVRPLRWIAFVAAVLAVSACPSTEPKGVDARAFSIDVTPDSAAIQSGLTAQLSATVKTKDGQDIPGVTITYESEDSTIAKVSEDGIVTGARAGIATVIASYGTLKAPAIITVSAGEAAVISKVGDAPLTPVVGATGNVSARVTDAAGNVVPNATVNFAVTAGGGSITPSATTNASGIATAAFTMGNTVGVNTATATLPGGSASVSFSTTSISAPSAEITKVSTDPTDIVAGDKFGDVKARVVDAFGNPKVGVTVVFSVSTGGGSITPTNAVTNASGEATASFTTGKTVGVNTARATVSGVSTPVTFSTTTIAGPSTKVKVSVPIVTVGLGSTTAVTATTADANNNPTTGTLTYESRSTSVATVAGDGTITGVAVGQTFIVASGPLGVDSLLVYVRPADAPVLMPEVAAYAVTVNTDIVVTISMDMTGSSEKLGATTVKLEWDPTVLTYRSNAAGTTGLGLTVNTTAATAGSFTFAISNSTGVTGRVALVKVTLHASTTAGKSGTLRLVPSEAMAAGTFIDLLPKTQTVLVPIITR